MINRFKKVSNGLYRGSCPSMEDVFNLKDKYHIKKIISLDKECGNKIRKICKKLNIEQKIIPIDGSKKSLLNLLNYNLYKLLIENGPTFVHCKYGKDRTGLICALFSCQYLNKTSKQALEEAKKLDFGTGLQPEIRKLYENLIKNCNKDNNSLNDSINYYSDSNNSYLDEADSKSFAPFLDQPVDFIYNDIYNQSPTRENYTLSESIKEHNNKDNIVPIVGLFNNDAGIQGAGPTEPVGGFIYE